jgi:hypothetical protein
MNMHGRIEGAALRQRITCEFDRPPPLPGTAGLGYIRASGLAQVRLQLAVLSGNRRGALRELDRLVEIDRQLEAIGAGQMPGASLVAQLDEQRQAIATEKLALMAAIEFPALAPAERSAKEPAAAEDDFVVIEDTEFGRKLGKALAWLLGLLVMGTMLAFALPALAMV